MDRLCLGKLGDRKYIPELKKALQDAVPLVVSNVIEALEKLDVDQETKKIIHQRKDELLQINLQSKIKISKSWTEKTEYEKKQELLTYAANAHIRENQKKILNQKERLNLLYTIEIVMRV